MLQGRASRFSDNVVPFNPKLSRQVQRGCGLGVRRGLYEGQAVLALCLVGLELVVSRDGFPKPSKCKGHPVMAIGGHRTLHWFRCRTPTRV